MGFTRPVGSSSAPCLVDQLWFQRRTPLSPPSAWLTSRRSPQSPQSTKDLVLQVFDGASRTRTGDLLGAIQALSQLSYSPARRTV
jgi:hypothetical protein